MGDRHCSGGGLRHLFLVRGTFVGDEEIAQRTQANEKLARKRRQSVMTKLSLRHEWELREWALAHRLIPEPPARHWYERTVMRGTLAGGGLIGLLWTLQLTPLR